MKLYNLFIFLLYSFLLFAQISFATSKNIVKEKPTTNFKLISSDEVGHHNHLTQTNNSQESDKSVIYALSATIFILIVVIFFLIFRLSNNKKYQIKLNQIIRNLEKEKFEQKEEIQKLNKSFEKEKVSINEIIKVLEREKSSQKEELNELNKSLQEKDFLLNDINTKKDKFLSIMSQDLKAPLNSLVGFTELFITEIDNVDKSKIKDLAFHFRKSIKNLSNLLENLLEWSRMQMGVKYFHPCKIDIDALILKNINLLKDQASQKKIDISFKSNGQLFVLADVNMFNSVINHLISNAIKFSNKESKIDVSYSNKEGICEVVVKDFGIGLDDYSLKKVFKIDKHFTTEGTNREKGTGLGLILCKEFVEKNNGKIWLNSKPGKGTDAHFTIKVFPE